MQQRAEVAICGAVREVQSRMNRRHKSQRDRVLDALLTEWGEQELREHRIRLGYPSSSVEARVYADGRTRSVKTSPRGKWVNNVWIPAQEQACKETRTFQPQEPRYEPRPRVQAARRGYNAIERQNWKLALWVRFAEGVSDHRKAGTMCEWSERKFSEQLAQARAFMEGWLSEFLVPAAGNLRGRSDSDGPA